MSEIGRNDPCHCGSKKKYKKCHLEKDEMKNRKVREKAALNAAKVAAKEAEDSSKTGTKKTPPQENWFGRFKNKMGFSKNPASSLRSFRNKSG